MLRLISAGAAQPLVGALAEREGTQIGGHFGAVGAMLEHFRAGEPCDVVILTHAQVADLVAEGKALGATSTDLGSVSTSIAVREGHALPQVGDADSLRKALLAADAIHFPDPAKATAGIHFAGVLEKLGIAEETRARLAIFPNGATAMRAMATAPGNPIGCTQATEILATPGVRLVAPLPDGLALETVYTAAVTTRAADAEGARRFVAAIASEDARGLRTKAGFAGCIVRVAQPADFDAIRAIVRSVLAEYGLACDPADADRDLVGIEASYFERGGMFDVVVAEDGAIAGCCGVYPIDATTCELRKMYLLGAARGKGLGRRLLRRALSYARGQGFRRIELETASVMKDAIDLYTREGFRPIPRTRLAARCDRAFALEL